MSAPTADELIAAARTMDAAGVPPDAPPEAIEAVVLVLRYVAWTPPRDCSDEVARASAAAYAAGQARNAGASP